MFGLAELISYESRYAVWLTDRSGSICQKEWQQEREKMRKQPDNSFSKRGSCPPVGAPIELWVGGSFAYKCEFICMRGNDYIVWNLDADRPDCADFMFSEFRPLRTEREKAIENMARIIADHGGVVNDISLGALVDAGFKIVNP